MIRRNSMHVSESSRAYLRLLASDNKYARNFSTNLPRHAPSSRASELRLAAPGKLGVTNFFSLAWRSKCQFLTTSSFFVTPCSFHDVNLIKIRSYSARTMDRRHSILGVSLSRDTFCGFVSKQKSLAGRARHKLKKERGDLEFYC